MQYTMKAGVLYQGDSQIALAKIKSVLIGSQKKIYKVTGELLSETSIRYLDESKATTGDVRNQEYILTDSEGRLLGCARPGYAEGDSPEEMGWPICRMPRVDRAHVSAGGIEYTLTMHNSQNYSLTDACHAEVLRIMHRGIAGGWTLEDNCGFSPEMLCGIFIFCRYIEQENEFMIV